jgi:phage gp46-like protein
MSDLKIRWDSDLMTGDMVFADNDWEMDEGLGSAVIISLFSDMRADIGDQLPDPESTDRRGFWGDILDPDVVGDKLGSKLWLLERAIMIDKDFNLVEQYVLESLEWMKEDDVAKDIQVTVERKDDGRVYFQADIYKSDDTVENLRFDLEWMET